jgi:hypothetical protein
MYPFGIIVILSLLCYLIIPGIGAFWVRHRWRHFRKELIKGSLFKHAGYADIKKSEKSTKKEVLGSYKFFGTLEAIEEDHTIWLRNGTLTIPVNMEGSKVYLLPSENEEREGIEESPKIVRWERISSLTEGTKVFVSGILFADAGRYFFKTAKNHELLVIMYDGEDRSLLRRSIQYGRQMNEYWNQFTPAALGVGFLSLIILASVLMKSAVYRFGSLLALTSGLIPLLPFIPPGVLFFWTYRRFWRRGRNYRAKRDLVRLPMRFYDGNIETGKSVPLPDGQAYRADLLDFGKKEGEYHKYINECIFFDCKQLESGCKETEYIVFGQESDAGDPNQLTLPDDPMADFIILPDYPDKLSHQFEARAKIYELLAGFFFAAGLTMNFFLTAYLLITFIL